MSIASQNATEKRPTYENFIAVCPVCGYRNIFNRISDLQTTEPISFRQVGCLNEQCRKPFNITGDYINPAFSMLILDCYELREEKKYSSCILNLAQAFEMFVSHYLQVELLYRPFWREGKHDLGHLNQLAEKLYRVVRPFAFDKLRAIFLNRVLYGKPSLSLDDSEKAIKDIPNLTKMPCDARLATIANAQLHDLLLRFKKTEINELRNCVIHKYAYRPRREEVDCAIEETRAILPPLAHHLRIDAADINWYARDV